MNEQEIIEGNKLIAEFMGAEYVPDGTGRGMNHVRFPNDPRKDGKMRFFAVDDLKYHSSWDWLMPVVEKIYQQRIVSDITIRLGQTKIFLKELQPICSPLNPHNTPMQECWYAVTDFIKWHNNEKARTDNLTQHGHE